MKMRIKYIFVIAVVVFFCGAMTMFPLQTCAGNIFAKTGVEVEANDSFSDAMNIEYNVKYECSIKSSDKDYFKVNLVKGEVYTVIIENFEAIADHLYIQCYDETRSESNMKYIHGKFKYNSATGQYEYIFTTKTSGVYFFVFTYFGNEINYSVVVSCENLTVAPEQTVNPVIQPIVVVGKKAEVEANDSFSDAMNIEYNVKYECSIKSSDKDYFKVNLVKGEVYTVVIENFEAIADKLYIKCYDETRSESNMKYIQQYFKYNSATGQYEYIFTTKASGIYYFELQYYGNEKNYSFVVSCEVDYVGNINSELLSFELKQSDNGGYYLTGQIVVVEWVEGVSTVPRNVPTMSFKSTDGVEKIEVFVTPTGTNTYYFDRFIESLTEGRQYVFEITSGSEKNLSPHKSMNVSLATSPKMPTTKDLGSIGEQNISYFQSNDGELRLYGRGTTYVGNINSELKKTELVQGANGNYVSGEIVVVEWVNGISTVPKMTPIMYFKSTDGLESLPVFITATGTNTYYFDRSLGDMDTSKEYVFTIESGDETNVSLYRAMIVTTAAMENKTGTLWESDTQYVRYRTDANTGELRIYAVNK